MTPSACRETALRQATEADLPAVLGMLEQFVGRYYDGLIACDQAAQLSVAQMALEQGGLWVVDTDGDVEGVLGLVLAPLPSSGELAALECAWWVNPIARTPELAREMFDAAERWAQAHGAAVMQLTQPAQARPAMARYYRSLGFVAVETTWQKRLA